MIMHIATVDMTYMAAIANLPFWSILTFCIENVENVVKPPPKPTIRTFRSLSIVYIHSTSERSRTFPGRPATGVYTKV